jgi:2-dehydro-3-deoxyphosphooctonate aldolase (KDO 8-P synthase)
MTAPRHVHIGNVAIGNDRPLALIAGPCQLESRQHALEMSHALVEMTGKLGMGLIYKTSFDKANRTSASGARGLGLEKSLPIMAEIREKWGCPVLTDVHEPGQCAPVAEAVDVLQIPAFLCRQTDLLVAAAKTGRAVNVKKGQFLAPWDMRNVAAKISGAGNENILLTERGASFGYNNLVTDMRGLPIMAETGYPVVMDATHAVQQPGGHGAGARAGRRRDRHRRRVHGDAPGSGPRAVGRTQHDPAEGHAGDPADVAGIRPHRQSAPDFARPLNLPTGSCP